MHALNQGCMIFTRKRSDLALSLECRPIQAYHNPWRTAVRGRRLDLFARPERLTPMTESGTSLIFSAYDFVVTDRSRTRIEGGPATVGLREVGLLCDEGISLLSEKQLASQIKGFRKRERHPEQHELRPSRWDDA